MKLLFVCTRNICRSPVAAAIARDLLETWAFLTEPIPDVLAELD
jgi:protein-tyrosine-phosphatase